MMPYCIFFFAYLIYVVYIVDLDENYQHEDPDEYPSWLRILMVVFKTLLFLCSLFFLS